ncbi:MAG: histidinol-phosphate transaminase [Kineosporiaceae bacterium]|nr:histidinol-phosphate transaminase [Aeromicrobium sp.]
MPIPEWVPIREDLRGFEPYGAPQMTDVICLNVNENPYSPSAVVAADIAESVRDVATGLNRYPDREATELRAALAEYLGHDLGSEQVWAANGSNEVMLQILQAFGGPGRSALSFAPTYSMYPEYARDTNTDWVTGQRDEDFTVDVDRAVSLINAVQPEVVFLASPNNPTGTVMPFDTIRAVLAAAPGVVVIDEAYAEFCREGTPSALELLADNPRLLVSRTMSKAFALAGARLGYVAADKAIIDALRIVRLPYHLSAVTQAVALAALRHSDELLATVDELRATRDELVTWFEAQGIETAATDANFVLFGQFADRHAIWQGLVDRGVLIRETGPQGWLRVSVGTRAEMEAFYRALQEVLGR